MNSQKFNQILIYIIFFLVFIILFGTFFWGLQFRPKTQQNEIFKNETNSYFELGNLRIKTQDSVLLVVSPYILYPENDVSFFEEISRKKILLKNVIQDYFDSKTKNQIIQIPEEKRESEILILINEKLSLGKISNIYFTNFMFFD